MNLNQNVLDMKIGGKVCDSSKPQQNTGFGIYGAAGACGWDNNAEFSTGWGKNFCLKKCLFNRVHINSKLLELIINIIH